MRIQSTVAFAAAHAKYDFAYAAWHGRAEFENNPGFTASDLKLLETNMLEGADTTLRTPAYTSTEVVQKIDVMLEHVDDDGRGFGWRMIERDIHAMSRPTPGPDMRSAFRAWRTAWRDMALHDASETFDDGEADRLHHIMSSAMEAIFRVPCTTPGDFVVKAYVNLIWCAGHTDNRESRRCGTGNFFDIDVMEIDSDSLMTDTYYRSVYDDLDHSDLGACLLAGGTIDFDPAEWMQTADRIGMSVVLIVRDGGPQAISISLIDSTDQRLERLQREQRRLQRILSHDHHDREQALGAYLLHHRPECVVSIPPKVAA